MTDYIRIHPSDNVAVALNDLKSGTTVRLPDVTVSLVQDIPRGHKFALLPLSQGEAVVKYGNPIGNARSSILPGEWVHTHNLKTGLDGLLEYTYQPQLTPLPVRPSGTFRGYRRENGKVGVRNELWIIPTVGCVNSIATSLEKRSQHLVRGSVEGIYAFPHPYGCSQLSEDHENTQKALCGLIRHPNAGGVLVLALGCENNTVDSMKAMLGEYDERRVKFLVCQEHEDEIADSLVLLEQLAEFAGQSRREDLPMSELIVGLKCGASDGLSGITANPLVGAFSDRLLSEGGSTILTEVPEMFGAETLLMNRCVSREVFDRTVALINDFKEYFLRYNQTVYENPSPGNKAGGITTLEDKSLGCTQKGGSAPVSDVLFYGEPVKCRGLSLLQAPGNDLVASTAEAVSGAHIVLFTTGRGTPFGCPVPTLKISSNTALREKKPAWIDFDAGPLVSGDSPEEMTERFYEHIRQVASGELLAKNELYGLRDIAIFKDGVTL